MRRSYESRSSSVWVYLVAGAVIGVLLGILVSVTIDVPFAPEVGLILGAFAGWLVYRVNT
jgi:hypothetical protein